jgi:hypothetical protein
MRRLFLAFLTTLLLASFAMADTIYLRDGRTIKGTLLGFVNGRFAVRTARITPGGYPNPDTTSSEIVFFRPNEVERIELDGRSLDELKYETREVQVSLGPDWIDSGVDIRRNERVKVTATGTIVAGRSRITPEGLRSNDPSSPLPRSPEGMLIGAIGNDVNSPVIELGASREFVAERNGRLYLTANRSSYTDARGAFNVQIQRERDLTASDVPIDNRDGSNAPRRPRGPRERRPLDVVIDVPGTSRAVDTNIDVRAGDQLTFGATGTVVAGRRAGEVGPDGGRSSGFGSIVGTRPVPSAGVGALIGFIRLPNGQTSQPFLIGSQSTYTAAADGRLMLAINDDNYSDNSGSFSVKISY